MGYDPIAVEYTDLRCSDCGVKFSIVSTTGPVNTCEPCYLDRVTAILTDTVKVEHLVPVPGDRVSCGNRKDLPPELRVHAWMDMGVDVRHFDDGYLMEALVSVCTECGRDRMKDARPKKPKPTPPPPMPPEVKAKRDALRRELFEVKASPEFRAMALAEFDKHNLKGE